MRRGGKKGRKRIPRFITILIILILLLGLGTIFLAPDIVDYGYEYMYPLNYKDYVLEYSEKYGVDKYLMFALIRTESAFNSDAVSSAGAIGLTQIMPDTGQWLASKMGMEVYSEDMLYIPETNIEISCYYINMLIEMFGNVDTALAAYNAGMGTVGGWLDDSQYSEDGVMLSYIPYEETRNYVEKINSAKEVYMDLYPDLV